MNIHKIMNKHNAHIHNTYIHIYTHMHCKLANNNKKYLTLFIYLDECMHTYSYVCKYQQINM